MSDHENDDLDGKPRNDGRLSFGDPADQESTAGKVSDKAGAGDASEPIKDDMFESQHAGSDDTAPQDEETDVAADPSETRPSNEDPDDAVVLSEEDALDNEEPVQKSAAPLSAPKRRAAPEPETLAPDAGGSSGGGGVFMSAMKFAGFAFSAGAVALIGAVGFAAWYLNQLNQDLPDYQQLADYAPPVTTRVYAGDGSLVAEFARERRLFVPIESIPVHVKQAFVSAEDKSFYEHSGLDFRGLVRAQLSNIGNVLQGRRLEGGSTITQQVAKNFLLTSEQRIERKLREMLIARKMERTYTKDHILELYLNEIYLGNRSYGVAAAALNYFDKSLAELTIAEASYLAAITKGP
ncbi:MAG: transglycosylase domain-containing protein, partial [Pseudomonadota bacterium]